MSTKTLLQRLPTMTAKQLQAEYAKHFGEPTRSTNKSWMMKRIAWRLQSLGHLGLSPESLAQASELLPTSTFRLNPPPALEAQMPKPQASTPSDGRDPRLPAPGTILMRAYKGELLQVTINQDDFTYQGQHYTSLSAIARLITGSHCNGFRFFNLTGASA
jgi:hypothetical protein